MRETTTSRGYGARWQRMRLLVLNRDGWRCWRCGGPAREVHHLRPISRHGASYDPRHLGAACHPCNLAVRELPARQGKRARVGGAVPRRVVHGGAIEV
jgi:5-methylcytosine-specific restriction endonuclease McrA